MRYDADSGQVFAETVVSLHRKLCKCIHEARNPPPRLGVKRPKTPTLKRLAVKALLRNLDLLGPDSLSNIPTSMLETIWTEISKAGRDTLHIWTLFVQTSMATGSFKHDFHCQCASPSMPAIMKIGTSQTFTWLTDLEVFSETIEPSDMVECTKLVNLRTLLVCPPSKKTSRSRPKDIINDHVIRTWSDAALGNGAFKKLQMMFIGNQDGVTHWSLYRLSNFPVLQTFNIRQGFADVNILDYKTPSEWQPSYTGDGVSKTETFASYARRQMVSRHRLSEIQRPALNLTFGDSGDHRGSVWHVVSFKRDLHTAGKSSSANSLVSLPASSIAASGSQERALKKRKIKDRKSTALQDLLGGM